MFAASTTAINIMFLFHILSALVAFGPLFVVPVLARNGNLSGVGKMYITMVLPALLFTMVFGMGLQGMQSELYSLSQLWLWLSFAIWIALMAVGALIINPALNKGGPDARSKLSMGVGITHLGMLVTLILMIWKPGL